LHTSEGWLYLAVLIDLYNRKVIGWSASAGNDASAGLSMLCRWLDRRNTGLYMVLFTTRIGAVNMPRQITEKLLSNHGIACSMSRKGNCYDNAVAESFFHLPENRMGQSLPVP
jgi:putative transposase